jgi:ankyrin repeat protein
MLNKAKRFFYFLTCTMIGLLGLQGSFAGYALAADKADVWVYIKNDQVDNLRDILRAGLDPNIKKPEGDMPAIMQAVRDSAWKSFDVLLASKSINLNLPNAYQETPLMYVALTGELDRAKQMISKGAEVNNLGWTPLHYASLKGHLPVVQLLLSKGALPNAPSPDGTSPLMMAVQSKNFQVIQALINAGADPAARNLEGKDAIDVALKQGNSDWANQMTKIVTDRRAKAKANSTSEQDK